MFGDTVSSQVYTVTPHLSVLLMCLDFFPIYSNPTTVSKVINKFIENCVCMFLYRCTFMYKYMCACVYTFVESRRQSQIPFFKCPAPYFLFWSRSLIDLELTKCSRLFPSKKQLTFMIALAGHVPAWVTSAPWAYLPMLASMFWPSLRSFNVHWPGAICVQKRASDPLELE